VLVISVDALNPKAITGYPAYLTPSFHRLIAQGASTMNARTLYERTETLPNHTSMLTGRRMALPRGTGVGFNTDNGKTVHASARHYVASMFDVVHDRGGRTALYTAKSKFDFLNRSWNSRYGAPDRVGGDNGRDKIDRYVHEEAREGVLVTKLVRELRNSPRKLTFLHLAGPDRAGHAYGGMSAHYLSAVRATDRLIGRVLAAIDSSPRLRQHLLVVVTSDHGTAAHSHADAGKPANYRIPFMAWGPGVAKGADLYALNPDFARPGRRRPGYAGAQPIRNGDVANLVTDELDLPVVPGSELACPGTLDLD
jgi:predicted AlkP superfamily pyrophosphatase or phosphodiesterase